MPHMTAFAQLAPGGTEFVSGHEGGERADVGA